MISKSEDNLGYQKYLAMNRMLLFLIALLVIAYYGFSLDTMPFMVPFLSIPAAGIEKEIDKREPN